VVKEENKNQATLIKKSSNSIREKVTSTKNEEVEPVQILKDTEKELIALSENVSMEPIAKAEKPIVIEFTLDPVPSTTLVAKAPEAEKNNGFKKILDKAIDLKNGEGLGGLRDAKNELLAFDFKKDKTKRN